VTPSGGGDTLIKIFFAAEFTITLDKRPHGKAERVGVATVVCRRKTKKVITFWVKRVTPSDTDLDRICEVYLPVPADTPVSFCGVTKIGNDCPLGRTPINTVLLIQ